MPDVRHAVDPREAVLSAPAFLQLGLCVKKSRRCIGDLGAFSFGVQQRIGRSKSESKFAPRTSRQVKKRGSRGPGFVQLTAFERFCHSLKGQQGAKFTSHRSDSRSPKGRVARGSAVTSLQPLDIDAEEAGRKALEATPSTATRFLVAPPLNSSGHNR